MVFLHGEAPHWYGALAVAVDLGCHGNRRRQRTALDDDESRREIDRVLRAQDAASPHALVLRRGKAVHEEGRQRLALSRHHDACHYMALPPPSHSQPATEFGQEGFVNGFSQAVNYFCYWTRFIKVDPNSGLVTLPKLATPSFRKDMPELEAPFGSIITGRSAQDYLNLILCHPLFDDLDILPGNPMLPGR